MEYRSESCWRKRLIAPLTRRKILLSVSVRTPTSQRVSGESQPEAGVSHAVGIKQPAKGWKEVERTLPWYLKTNAGKTKQSRYYYKQKEKQKKQRRKWSGVMERFHDYLLVLHHRQLPHSRCCQLYPQWYDSILCSHLLSLGR